MWALVLRPFTFAAGHTKMVLKLASAVLEETLALTDGAFWDLVSKDRGWLFLLVIFGNVFHDCGVNE